MNRRVMLRLLGCAPFAGSAPGAARITVTGLEIFNVPVNRRGNWILLRVSTSAGVTGIGDASHGGQEAAKIPLIRQFFETLKGRSAYDVEHLRTSAEPVIAKRGAVAAVAMCGLEQCLWDIQGKAAGVPACDLFGGRLRSRIRNYANINRSTEERVPAAFAANAERAVAAGFDAIKLAPFDGMPAGDTVRRAAFTKTGLECAAAVRKAIGPKRDLLIDGHSHFGLEDGLALARSFEPLDLFWLEEVTPPPHLPAINRAAKMPTAGGEAIYGVKGFLPYIKAECVDIVMPDVKYCGGMLELKKISALAEAAGLPVAPHGPASPVGNVAAAQVCASIPNFHILEFSFGEVPWRAEVIDPPEQLDKGYLAVSEKPGLGISLNDKLVGKHKVEA
jgi:galactonate dehydratase